MLASQDRFWPAAHRRGRHREGAPQGKKHGLAGRVTGAELTECLHGHEGHDDREPDDPEGRCRPSDVERGRDHDSR